MAGSNFSFFAGVYGELIKSLIEREDRAPSSPFEKSIQHGLFGIHNCLQRWHMPAYVVHGNFAGKNLSGFSLQRIHFFDTNLNNTINDHTNYKDSVFEHTSMVGATGTKTEFGGAQFLVHSFAGSSWINPSFVDTTFSVVEVNNAWFISGNFSASVFQSVIGYGASWREGNFSGVLFGPATRLCQPNFYRCQFPNATFWQGTAKGFGATPKWKNFPGANFESTEFAETYKAHLRRHSPAA